MPRPHAVSQLRQVVDRLQGTLRGESDGLVGGKTLSRLAVEHYLRKNLIDWASRYQPQPFKDKHALLVSASPSMAGGNRGLWALRVPLEHLGVHVYPDMFSLAQAHQAFDHRGQIADERLAERFDRTIADFLALTEAAVHYPCAKSAWIEFLGEHPDPVLDRVQE